MPKSEHFIHKDLHALVEPGGSTIEFRLYRHGRSVRVDVSRATLNLRFGVRETSHGMLQAYEENRSPSATHQSGAIESASSEPPHIEPPIAQVPRPMRETGVSNGPLRAVRAWTQSEVGLSSVRISVVACVISR